MKTFDMEKEYIITRYGDPEYIRFLPTKGAVEIVLNKQKKLDKEAGIEFRYDVQEVSRT